MDSAQGITEVAELELGTPLTERDVASYRRLIEASDTLICELDLEGRFVKANGPRTPGLRHLPCGQPATGCDGSGAGAVDFGLVPDGPVLGARSVSGAATLAVAPQGTGRR